MACEKEDLDLCTLLVNAGADINACVTPESVSLLKSTAHAGKYASVEFFIDVGAHWEGIPSINLLKDMSLMTTEEKEQIVRTATSCAKYCSATANNAKTMVFFLGCRGLHTTFETSVKQGMGGIQNHF